MGETSFPGAGQGVENGAGALIGIKIFYHFININVIKGRSYK